ncbi:transporter substrate-binding domain-containing protein [Devosia sp. 2618]|uniref:substrate-binding periplasmic protein n=1 Tax=Devosia sp. 2618 TaxID=3156454 RepID=UPI0033986E65
MYSTSCLTPSHRPLGHARPLTKFMLTLLSAALLLPFAAAIAQEEVVPRDLYEERRRNEGNSIAFCLRPNGPLAAYEGELAEAIGQVLLTDVRTYTLGEKNFPVRPSIYDYLFGLTDEQMFIMMAEHCDVVLGMHLSSASPEWLRLSRPYIVARMLGISRDPSVKTLSDLKPGARIGAQAMAAGDSALTSYLRTVPADTAPLRVIFRDNEALFKAFANEQVDAALLWEGALMAGTEGNPAGYYAMESLPFPVDTVQISAAVRAGDNVLGALVDEAIAALEADGTLAQLAERHKIVWPDPA